MKFNILSTDNTQNRFGVEIPENIRTWGELKEHMGTLGVNIGSAKATYVAEGDALNNMSPDDESVPFPLVDGFVVSLSPASTKFGAITYNEMKSYVKEARQKAEISKDTKVLQLIGDYTRLKTDEMVRLYNDLKQINEGTQIVKTTTLVPDSSDIYRRLALLEKTNNELLEKLDALTVRIEDLEEEIFGENLTEDNDDSTTAVVVEETNPNILAAKRKLGLA